MEETKPTSKEEKETIRLKLQIIMLVQRLEQKVINMESSKLLLMEETVKIRSPFLVALMSQLQQELILIPSP